MYLLLNTSHHPFIITGDCYFSSILEFMICNHRVCVAFINLFLLVFYFFSFDFLFLFFAVVFCFFCLNCFSWCGLFFFVDSYVYVILIYIRIFIFCLILFSEKNKSLVFLSQALVVISFCFFIPFNVFFFYIFFELSIFPILIMILGYGYQIEKVSASFYLIFYTSLCSFPFLFVFLNLDFSLIFVYFDFVLSWELVFILTMAFMIKFPVFFLHLWLPKAHVEAPTSASMLLAGLLLKFGTIGFVRVIKSLRFCHVNFWVFVSIIGFVMSAFSCVFQSDTKSLAAYSSISHMSFLLLGLLFFSVFGKTGGLLIIVAHGYTSTIMFYFIGIFYSSVGSRMIYYLNSFIGSGIILCILFSFSFLSNAGVPPSLSFFSEFIFVSGSFIFFSGLFFFVFVYFFVSFYYSIFFVVNLFIGKKFFFFNFWGSFFRFFLVFMCFNVFWLGVFF